MSVDIYRSRRGHFFKCLYWKRDVSQYEDNEELIHNQQPSGMFYAKIEGNNNKDTQDIANVMHFGYEDMTISTEDDVNISKDDLVLFKGKKWMAIRINEVIVQKNSEFSSSESKITTIVLRSGD